MAQPEQWAMEKARRAVGDLPHTTSYEETVHSVSLAPQEVRDAERSRCAKVCDEYAERNRRGEMTGSPELRWVSTYHRIAGENCADEIRADEGGGVMTDKYEAMARKLMDAYQEFGYTHAVNVIADTLRCVELDAAKAERERCAKVAEQWVPAAPIFENCVTRNNGAIAAQIRAGEHVASAIRAGET